MIAKLQSRSKTLPVLLGLLAVAVLIYVATTVRPRPAPVPASRLVPQATAVRPGSRPAAPVPSSSPSSGAHGPSMAPHAAGPTPRGLGLPIPRTPGGPGIGAVGRPDPFVPLVVPPQPGGNPVTASQPASPSALGLPLPPGFTTPSGPGRMNQVLQAPAPGAGMTVTGIVGNSPRVAIIQSQGRSYVVGVGEQVGDAVVLSIDPQRVTLKRGSVTFELSLGGERSS